MLRFIKYAVAEIVVSLVQWDVAEYFSKFRPCNHTFSIGSEKMRVAGDDGASFFKVAEEFLGVECPQPLSNQIAEFCVSEIEKELADSAILNLGFEGESYPEGGAPGI